MSDLDWLGPGYTLCKPPRADHDIFLSYCSNAVIPSVAAIRAMGDPEYIQLYVSREKRKVAIVPCSGDARGAHKMVKKNTSNNRKVNLPSLSRELAELAGVEFVRQKFHRAEGEYHEDGNYVLFDLVGSA